MLAGIVSVFVLKYLIVGLEQWDIAFHPERLQVDLSGPHRRFAKPLLGAFL